jgi:signal transduction histidine kinase/CheY-like chemotaxis protein
MSKFRHFIYIIGCLFFSNLGFGQTALLSSKQINELLRKSDSLLFASNFNESLKLSKQALEASLLLDDPKLISYSYNSIAGNLEEIHEEDQALDYYNKALSYANKDQSKGNIKLWLYNNIGNLYLHKQKKIEEALTYYKKSFAIATTQKDAAALVLINMNLAMTYFKKGEYETGYSHLVYSENNIKLFDYPDTQCYLSILLGIYNGHSKIHESAQKHFETAISIAKENAIDAYLVEACSHYSNYLYSIGDFENAFLFFKKEKEVSDKMFQLEKAKNADLVAMKIELDETKRSISKIDSEKKSQLERLKQSKTLVILFFILLIIMFLFLLSLYKNNKYKIKINHYLEEKNKELQIAKDQAEEASKLKTQFISTISHELRTPLYGVVGITNMLVDEHKELANSPHLNSLKFSARYLLSLVNDLLQINRIEENKIVLENLTFNLADEIYMVSKSLSYMADRNSNTIETVIDEKIPEVLVGDKLRLSQILMNLVSNGLKFTTNGVVSIQALLVATNETKTSVAFTISDTGIGIPAADLDKIFDKFVQIDRKEDDYQGTGLGLSIVKKLIKLFDSTIQVESTEGVGTTFNFTIVFDSDQAKVNEIINNIDVDLSSDKIYKVLVVEDNKINQMVTKKILEKSNFKSTIVDDGYAAIEAMGKEHFDVVLMDINMPLINGFETTRMIRQKGFTTPIIALTAFAKDEITEEALSVGMNDILIKPFEASKLTKMIESLTSKL